MITIFDSSLCSRYKSQQNAAVMDDKGEMAFVLLVFQATFVFMDNNVIIYIIYIGMILTA